MEVLFAIAVGVLYGTGLYLLLRRSFLKLVLALGLFTNAGNLLIFTSAGLVQGRPPLIPEDETALTGVFADPLPQALVLTAIVIGFGVQAFALVLMYAAHKRLGTDDVDDLVHTERDDAAEDGPPMPADGAPAATEVTTR